MYRTYIDFFGNIQYLPASNEVPLQNMTYIPTTPTIIDKSAASVFMTSNIPYSNSTILNLSPSSSFLNSTSYMDYNGNYNTINNADDNSDSNSKPYIYFTNPIATTYNSYVDVNNDPQLRKRMVDYFYHKFKQSWLPFSYIKIQKFLTNKDGKIELIKNVDEYEKNTGNDDNKIDFIIKNIFGKHQIVVFLDKFVNANNLNWYDLKNKHSDRIKYELYHKLKNHFKKIVLNEI
jgi:hypothetical protein